jgi:5'-nucleotidase
MIRARHARLRITLLARIACALCFALALLGPSDRQLAAQEADTVTLAILAINDFHGGLEPRGVQGRLAGGAVALAAYLDHAAEDARRQGIPSLVVGAGDLIGGSPPISALLYDQPTIDALGLTGLGFTALGNHELDRGVAELRRLVDGGCREPLVFDVRSPDAEGRSPPSFERQCSAPSPIRYLAANVTDEVGNPLFPAFAVQELGGVRVGFIGAVLAETPTIVAAEHVAGLRFGDEVESINASVAELRERGVRTIVVLIHQGGQGNRDGGPIRGPIVPIVEALDPEVDLVISGHTHRGYQGTVAGKLVTQAYAHGTAYANVELKIDLRSGDVVAKSAHIVDTFLDDLPAEPNPQIARIVSNAARRVAPLTQSIVARLERTLSRQPNAAGESALGNLIVDAHRWRMDADVAVTNPGGVRADLPSGDVTWGDLFAVQPFGNRLVRLRLSGDQLLRLLEQQWEGQPFPRVLHVSGLSYLWDSAAPVGARVPAAEARVGGEPLHPSTVYTVAVNDFLADGANNFSVFLEESDREVGPTDHEALVEYLERARPQVQPSIEGRIRRR